MLLVCYDFSNDKTRTKFSKFLEKYGHRVQYSVFVIENSPRMIELIKTEIEMSYKKLFQASDHILIIPLSLACQQKIIRYGSAVHELEDVVYF